jgi:hypothetical protein
MSGYYKGGYLIGTCLACEREIEIDIVRNLCIWLCDALIPAHIPKEQYRRYFIRVDGWKGIKDG